MEKGGTLLAKPGSLSIREVRDPLDPKEPPLTRHKKTLATRPGHLKSGRDWTRTNDLTDVNPTNEDRARNVILLEVESFNK